MSDDPTAPGWDRWDPSTVVELETAEDVTPEALAAAVECAFGSDGMGNRPGIDWEYAYDLLETTAGWFVSNMDSAADKKIRREVARLKRAGRNE
jgi:hypothetical protein